MEVLAVDLLAATVALPVRQPRTIWLPYAGGFSCSGIA